MANILQPVRHSVYDLVDEIISRAEAAFYPDGYILDYSEIRTGGWEPDQVANYSTTGEVLAAHVTEMVTRVDSLTGNKPLHIWSDTFDPYHNAFEHHTMSTIALKVLGWECR